MILLSEADPGKSAGAATEWLDYGDEGFLFSLSFSSHHALTGEIGVVRTGRHFVRAYEFVERGGDMISRLSAIKVGLRILPENSEIRPFIVYLIEQTRDDDSDRPQACAT